MSGNLSTTAAKWQEELARGGYERRIKDRRELRRATRPSRTWKYIFKATNLKPGASVFEFGCGGGKHLIPLAFTGYRCTGIDCSEAVLDRCRQVISDVEAITRKTLDIQLVAGDFLNFDGKDTYDLVFNSGVIEHFLDQGEREAAVRKMFHLCRPGGYVVSVVPFGHHPYRAMMRSMGWGGYRIPEIDYDADLMEKEMRTAGAESVQVILFNLYAYLLIRPFPPIRKLMMSLFYYLWQMIPLSVIPTAFASRHAFGLIGLGRKAG